MNDDKLIKLNLQYFANDEGGEKTEEPTEKKKEDTRKEGNVAKSVEITTAASFIFMFYAMQIFAGFVYEKVTAIMNYSLSWIPIIKEGITGDNFINKFVIYIFGQILIILAPFFIVAFLVGFITNLVQVGWHVTTKPLKPKFSRMNPISGFKRLFSPSKLFELLKSVVKVALIGVIIYMIVKDEINSIQMLLNMELLESISYIGKLVIRVGTTTGMYFILVAGADFLFQKLKHKKDIKMTKQEVKDEYKNSEGDPQIKGKIKQKMREVSMRRMMQSVPEADVIITNPTHYAVALKYDKQKSLAPIVVAKGEDFLAKRIKDVAREHNIQIVENKYLARTLYATVDIGKEIPPELYQAVAEVLAFVYNLKNR